MGLFMETDSTEAGNSRLSAKDFAVIAPILGSALCATFDVGYFWGVDINFFNAFSLTEHIVFSIQAIPIALASCCSEFSVSASFHGLARRCERSEKNEGRRKKRSGFLELLAR
jgi:hypothetical protein